MLYFFILRMRKSNMKRVKEVEKMKKVKEVEEIIKKIRLTQE